ncbi:Monophenol monooxygenase [Trichoderma sp. SZMC 28014]
MAQSDSLSHLTRAAVEALFPLPPQSSGILNSRYTINQQEEDSVHAYDSTIQTKIWFKSPPLTSRTIRRIRGLKLFAESHDQGWVDDETRGNWTWLELAILENESETSPKRDKDGNELTFTSHMNKIKSHTFEWLAGETFDRSRNLLRLLEAGNVIAVRLCAEYPNWAIHARNGYLVFDIDSDNYPVPIVPISIDATDKIPHRRNVTKWFEEAKTSQETALQLSLFIQAMNKFQLLPPEDQLSYFRIAGIHSYPPNVSWNMCKEPIPYDDPDMEKRMKNGEGGDYCAHNNFVFPTWHRAYMMLFERTISDIMMEEAKTRGPVWILAAKRWRLPYWDWASEPRLPELVLTETISIIDSWNPNSGAQKKVVTNPMYRFRMPGGLPMGDSKHGDYRIDGNAEGPWDLCVGTSRHAISYYDEKRNWVQGCTDADKVREALEGPLSHSTGSSDRLTLKDAVFRLLTDEYSTKYEHFASTKHKPELLEGNEAKGYLSLESIHNSVHNFIGGDNVVAGCGHMSSVPVAAFDPIFWLHHCNIDRLLHLWQCINPNNWFITANEASSEDGPKTDLVPFHHSHDIKDFFNSNRVRNVDYLNYTFDDMDYITDSEGEISPEKRNEYINRLYGPGHDAFHSPTEDVDPIINVIYDRYAFNGLSYALHFFLGPIERKVPYQRQPNLVGSIYTFTAPFTTPQGATGCSNCRKQAQTGVLSHAQIPLTRSVPIEERRDPEKAMKYLTEKLQWIAVFENGAKIPSKTLPGLLIELLLGKNQLVGGLKGQAKYGNYHHKEFDWKNTEL